MTCCLEKRNSWPWRDYQDSHDMNPTSSIGYKLKLTQSKKSREPQHKITLIYLKESFTCITDESTLLISVYICFCYTINLLLISSQTTFWSSTLIPISLKYKLSRNKKNDKYQYKQLKAHLQFHYGWCNTQVQNI